MRRAVFIRLIVVFLQVFTTNPLGTQQTAPNEPHRNGDSWAAQAMKQLSVEEKIGQMLQIRIFGDYGNFDEPAYRFVVDQIQKYRIGSVDLAARMLGPNLVKGAPAQIAAITNQLQRVSNLPLLVGSDIERGLASRLSEVPDFPFPMAFGAVGDAKLVEDAAESMAREARAVGIHWAFAPVADLNSNPANPIINTRSFGEDSMEVSGLVQAFIRGVHRGGAFVAVKHFPGHGDSSVDSHIGIVRVSGDRQHLDRYELLPFKMAIAAGADSVLLAHAAVPALDPDEKRITTTSPKIVTGLLKQELGFKGLVVTDALEMRGLMSLYPNDPNPSGRAAIDAIKAGADVLMLPQDLDATFNAIVSAVRSGEIPEVRIDESVRKILEMKEAAGLNKNRFVDLDRVHGMFPDVEANELAQRVSDEAVTLVRSNGAVLPLSLAKTANSDSSTQAPNESKFVVVSFTDSQNSRLGHEFDRQIMSRRPDARVFHYYNDHINSDAVPSEVLPMLKNAERVVVAAFVTHVPGRQLISHGRPVTAVGLSRASAEFLDDIVATVPQKTVVVSLGSPYLIQNYQKIENYICTYSLTSTAEISAAKALFGEIRNHAKLPVTLPGVAKRGFSLPWPKETVMTCRRF